METKGYMWGRWVGMWGGGKMERLMGGGNYISIKRVLIMWAILLVISFSMGLLLMLIKISIVVVLGMG
jgi:hypothetical protein